MAYGTSPELVIISLVIHAQPLPSPFSLLIPENGSASCISGWMVVWGPRRPSRAGSSSRDQIGRPRSSSRGPRLGRDGHLLLKKQRVHRLSGSQPTCPGRDGFREERWCPHWRIGLGSACSVSTHWWRRVLSGEKGRLQILLFRRPDLSLRDTAFQLSELGPVSVSTSAKWHSSEHCPACHDGRVGPASVQAGARHRCQRGRGGCGGGARWRRGYFSTPLMAPRGKRKHLEADPAPGTSLRS